MKWTDALPEMSEGYEVCADGVLVDVEPAREVPLVREYNFF